MPTVRAASPAPSNTDHKNTEMSLSRNSEHSTNSRKVLISKFRDAKLRIVAPVCTEQT